MLVFVGVRVTEPLEDVLDGDEPAKNALFIDDGELFDPVPGQRALRLIEGGANGCGYQPFLGHCRRDRLVQIAFELEINETSERIVVSNSKEYVATNGYSAEISFPLEKRNWKEVRAKQPLVFAGDTNIVVDINPSEVIIRAVSNEKTTTIPFNAVP